jgi:hypothetical protein
MTRPLALTDQQYAAVCLACEPLLPADRDAFLRALAQLLGGEAEIGDGTVARAIRSLQREFWRPPLNPGNSVPRPLKLAPHRGSSDRKFPKNPQLALGEFLVQG